MSYQQLSALYEEVVELIIDSLQRNDKKSIRAALEGRYPSELALILEALPHDERAEVWALLDAQIQGQVLHHLRDIARTSLIDEVGGASLVESGELMDIDELADIIEDLPEQASHSSMLSRFGRCIFK